MPGIGTALLVVYMTASGSLAAAGRATASRPLLLVYLFAVGVGLGTAVLAYTRLIQVSGPVVAVGVATLRKVATVVLSYVIFPDKPLTSLHKATGLLVLAGLVLSTAVGPAHRGIGVSRGGIDGTGTCPKAGKASRRGD